MPSLFARRLVPDPFFENPGNPFRLCRSTAAVSLTELWDTPEHRGSIPGARERDSLAGLVECEADAGEKITSIGMLPKVIVDYGDRAGSRPSGRRVENSRALAACAFDDRLTWISAQVLPCILQGALL